jgi:hypothetical protein
MRDGVSCFFDIESIGWGGNWVRALERAIDKCEYIVFVLSPNFCESEWAEMERTRISRACEEQNQVLWHHRKPEPLSAQCCGKMELPSCFFP